MIRLLRRRRPLPRRTPGSRPDASQRWIRSPAWCAALGPAVLLLAGQGSADRPQGDDARPLPKAPLSGERDGGSLRAPDELAIEAAVRRGLAFLAAAQTERADGSFPPAGAREYAPLATTALATLAFLSSGSSPDRGPFRDNVAAGVDYLLARVDPSTGSARYGYVADEGRDTLSRMHGHGFATLALSEAASISPRTPRGARISEALELAVRLIERSQGIEGGWGYQPAKENPLDHEGSVTIALVQGLRAAKKAGVQVDPTVIARAVDYVHRSQKEDGSFRYRLGDDTSTVALTAAAISTLHASGEYVGAPIRQGYDYIERELEARSQGVERALSEARYWPYYERLYLAQAFRQHPDPRVFERWYAAVSRELIATQTPEGSWKYARYGDCYATAMNLLVLTIPDGLLPTFQR